MAKREYFYTENGVTKTFIYCTRCGSGPFKENSPDIHSCGLHTNHCLKCLHDLKVRPADKVFSIEKLEEAVEAKPENPLNRV